MPSVVLIGPPDHLQALKERETRGDALAFSDAEALRALDAITRQRPGVVILERSFAATSRGAALVNRIKADPSLAGCAIEVVAHEAGSAPAPRSGGDAVAVATVSAPAPALAAAAVQVAPAAPLDQRGTRRAPRFKMAGGVEVQIDGNSATLIDSSTRRRPGGVADDSQAESADSRHAPERPEGRAHQQRGGVGVVRDSQGRGAVPRRR